MADVYRPQTPLAKVQALDIKVKSQLRTKVVGPPD